MRHITVCLKQKETVMRKSIKIVYLIVFIFFIQLNASAENPADSLDNKLTISDIVLLILENDSSIKISEQSLIAESNIYRRFLSDIYPQINLSGGYGFNYLSNYSSRNIDMDNYIDNNISTSVSMSQLIPTFGTLSLTLDNTMSIASIDYANSQSVNEPSFSQDPSISLSWVQPVFLNGTFIDMDLYPGTFNKSRISLLMTIQEDRIVKNTAIYDALSLVSSIINLRNSIELKEDSIELMQKHLAAMEQNLQLGLIHEVDVWELKIETGTERELLLNLKYSLIQAAANLRHVLNINYDVFFNEDIFNINLNTDDISEESIQNNPEIIKLRLSVEDARLNRIINGNKYSSTLTTSFSIAPRYSLDRINNLPSDFASSFTDFFEDDAGTEFSLTIELDIPLYNGKKRYYTENEDSAIENIALEELQLKTSSLIIEFQSLSIKQDNLGEKIILLENNIELIEKRVEIMRRLFEFGETTELDLIEVEIDLLEKNIELKETQAELFTTSLDIFSITGNDLSGVFLSEEKIPDYEIMEDIELKTNQE